MKRKLKQLLNIKKNDHDIFVGNLCPGLRHAKNMARLNHLMGSQSTVIDNWISKGNAYKNKRWKETCIDSLQHKEVNSRIAGQWMFVVNWLLPRTVESVGYISLLLGLLTYHV